MNIDDFIEGKTTFSPEFVSAVNAILKEQIKVQDISEDHTTDEICRSLMADYILASESSFIAYLLKRRIGTDEHETILDSVRSNRI